MSFLSAYDSLLISSHKKIFKTSLMFQVLRGDLKIPYLTRWNGTMVAMIDKSGVA